MRAPVYLAIHIPEFPAQAILRLRPELLRKPTVVLQGIPPLQQACSLNASARVLGVRHDMTRAQLDAFDGLHLIARSEIEERSAVQALLQAASVFTPRIEPQQSDKRSFRMVLDMSGTSLMWGEIETAIHHVTRAIRKLRFLARLAASSNVQAALCLASVEQREPRVIPAGEEAAALAPLPLNVLPLAPDMQETLTLWGLRTIGELAALPSNAVATRLGSKGEHLHKLACGTQPHLFFPQEIPFHLEEQVAFDAPLEEIDPLLFVLHPMLDQLICRAASRSYALAEVTTRLLLAEGQSHIRKVRPALPTSDRAILLKLIQLDLQTHPPSAGIMGIHMTAETGERSCVQMGMFSPQLPDSTRLDVTLARIAAMVGEDNVGCAHLLDTHGENKFAVDSFKVSSTKTRESLRSTSTALRRCRPTVPLRVYTMHRKHGARPLSFYLRGNLYVVMEAYGPWRKSGDWWCAEVWSREEWDIRATNETQGTLLGVLHHDLLRKLWALAATYD